MMQPWQVFGLVLLAILVGAGVPALVQLRRTLQSAQTFLDSTGKRLDRTLDEVTDAAARINRLGKSLEKDAEGLRVFTDAAAGLGRSLKQAQESIRLVTVVGSAVGPALVAGLRELFSTPEHDRSGPISPVGSESEAPAARGVEREPGTRSRHDA